MATRIPSESTFQVGASTGRTISTWLATLPKTVVLAAVALAPLFVFSWLVPEPGTDPNADPAAAGQRMLDDTSHMLVQKLIEMLCGGVLSGMVIHVAFKRLMKEPSEIGTAMSAGFRRVVPLLLVGLLTGLIAILPIAAILAVGMLADDLASFAWIFSLVSVAAAIFAAIVSAMFAAAAGAVVIESMGTIAALKRSLVLTRDFRGRIFGCSILVGIVGGIIGAILGFAGVMVLDDITSGIGAVLFGAAVALFVTPLTSTLSAVVYHDLRVTKEGVDLTDLMKVFA